MTDMDSDDCAVRSLFAGFDDEVLLLIRPPGIGAMYRRAVRRRQAGTAVVAAGIATAVVATGAAFHESTSRGSRSQAGAPGQQASPNPQPSTSSTPSVTSKFGPYGTAPTDLAISGPTTVDLTAKNGTYGGGFAVWVTNDGDRQVDNITYTVTQPANVRVDVNASGAAFGECIFLDPRQISSPDYTGPLAMRCRGELGPVPPHQALKVQVLIVTTIQAGHPQAIDGFSITVAGAYDSNAAPDERTPSDNILRSSLRLQ